jgi:2-oxoglutarate ferredoxin oxidoreductase subunit gamma
MVLNIVMVGAFAAIAGLITAEALRQAVADSVPPATRDLNLRAFYKGFEYGLTKIGTEVEEPAPASFETE